MATMAERVHWINEVAKADFDRASGMLDMFNSMCGTECGFLDGRVVYSDSPRGNTAQFYADCHDLETMLTR